MQIEHRTPDLYYASFLLAYGVPMVGTQRIDRRVYFIFDASGIDIDALRTSWHNGEGVVYAQAYSQHVKSLKALCFTT